MTVPAEVAVSSITIGKNKHCRFGLPLSLSVWVFASVCLSLYFLTILSFLSMQKKKSHFKVFVIAVVCTVCNAHTHSLTHFFTALLFTVFLLFALRFISFHFILLPFIVEKFVALITLILFLLIWTIYHVPCAMLSCADSRALTIACLIWIKEWLICT